MSMDLPPGAVAIGDNAYFFSVRSLASRSISVLLWDMAVRYVEILHTSLSLLDARCIFSPTRKRISRREDPLAASRLFQQMQTELPL